MDHRHPLPGGRRVLAAPQQPAAWVSAAPRTDGRTAGDLADLAAAPERWWDLVRFDPAGPVRIPVPGLAPHVVVDTARALAPAGTVATVDAGAHMLVAMPLWQVEGPGEALISSGLATMSFALPAAVYPGGGDLARQGRLVPADAGLFPASGRTA